MSDPDEIRFHMASRGYEAASLVRVLLTRVLQLADDEERSKAARNELADIGNALGIVEARVDELREYIEMGKLEPQRMTGNAP